MTKDDSASKQTIKIAPKSASKRKSGADPGPGDPAAAPSEAPELVEVPRAPTASQLVVKSGSEPSVSLKAVPSSMGKSGIKKSTSGAASSHHDHQQSGPGSGAVARSSGFRSDAASGIGLSSLSMSKKGASGQKSSGASSGPTDGFSLSKLPTNYNESTAVSVQADQRSSSEPANQSVGHKSSGHSARQSSVGAAELPSAAGSASNVYKSAGGRSELADGADGTSLQVATSQKSLGGAAIEVRGAGADEAETSPSATSGTESPSAESAGAAASSGAAAGADADAAAGSGGRHGKKKKVTKFRYHKRITVRTHGKTSPSSIMDKVSKKDKLTPSTIEDMDPQELIRRAGIKTAKNTHWRVRLRQTKRSTKNGKTVSQTKVAYRDSEGNKRVRTSSDPNCKKCGKKLEECKCDSNMSTGGGGGSSNSQA